MKTHTSTMNDKGVMEIVIDVPGETMNVFNQQVITEFDQITQEIEANNQIKAIVITSGKDEGFIAGADLKMLQAADTVAAGSQISQDAHRILGRIANSKKPYIIAIDGLCLGAGYELALACHYRIATDQPETKVGLPEVMVGLLPGGMGNTLLPRLIDLPSALDILLTGKQLRSKQALRLGMIDEVVPKKILRKAATLSAERFINSGIPNRKKNIKSYLFTIPPFKNIIISQARKKTLKKTHGLYPAPLAILDVVQQGLNCSIEDALKLEASAFGQLVCSQEAKQLINTYFSTTSLKKDQLSKEKEKRVKKLGILGGGLMGAGIATISIDKANTQVRIKDINDNGIIKTYAYLNQFYNKQVQRKLVSKEDTKKKLNQLTSSLDYTGFDKCDLIIEAVFEDLSLKHKMVEEIESLSNNDIVFASNTSSISIANIAKHAKYPQNIIGMHYFSPVEKMPLLEIVKHEKVSEQTLATAIEFGKQQGKTIIIVNDGAGFYVNRILAPYLNSALELGLEGVPFNKIDEAMVKFGFPIGPIKLLDEVGIDVASKTQTVLESAFGERMDNNGIQQKLITHQRLGKKVKKGFYCYDTPKNSQNIDSTIYQDLEINQTKELDDADIVKRCLYPMLNEATATLSENIIQSARDGDIGAIFGIGFPPFLGGPFRYMDTLGIDNIIETLISLEQRYGIKYKPNGYLLTMKRNKENFY